MCISLSQQEYEVIDFLRFLEKYRSKLKKNGLKDSDILCFYLSINFNSNFSEIFEKISHNLESIVYGGNEGMLGFEALTVAICGGNPSSSTSLSEAILELSKSIDEKNEHNEEISEISNAIISIGDFFRERTK